MIDLFSMSQKQVAYQLLAIEFICLTITNWASGTADHIMLMQLFILRLPFHPKLSGAKGLMDNR